MNWRNRLSRIAGWHSFLEIVFIVAMFVAAAIIVTMQDCGSGV